MFDWVRFLRAQGVPYVTRGPNTGAGQVSCRCPWCGPADPSHHLSISLRGEGYRCWRNPRAHAGRARWRLIAALLNCSPEEAHRLAGDELPATPEDQDLHAQVAALLAPAQAQPELGPLQLLPEFKPLRGATGLASWFWHYLCERGLAAHIDWVCGHYSLCYATRGRYQYRIIVPVHSVNAALMTWTARTIRPQETVRYKALPMRPPFADYSGPLARKAPSQLLLDLPGLLQVPNPKVLVVCEGPFDAIKVSALGRADGVYGTCLFGLHISEAQALLIERLAARFERVVILLDPEAALLNLRIKAALTCRVVFGRLPAGVEDPGAFNRVTFNDFLGEGSHV